MDDTPILDAEWPPDLDPADVPFRTRTVTIPCRVGFFDNPSLSDTLTEAMVLSRANAGPITVTDIGTTGNEAIRRHHGQVAQLPHSKPTWL